MTAAEQDIYRAFDELGKNRVHGWYQFLGQHTRAEIRQTRKITSQKSTGKDLRLPFGSLIWTQNNCHHMVQIQPSGYTNKPKTEQG